MNTRTLKLIAVSYALKTLLVGIAWLVFPELPQRAIAAARNAWSAVAAPEGNHRGTEIRR
jgi:hypothetical protein